MVAQMGLQIHHLDVDNCQVFYFQFIIRVDMIHNLWIKSTLPTNRDLHLYNKE